MVLTSFRNWQGYSAHELQLLCQRIGVASRFWELFVTVRMVCCFCRISARYVGTSLSLRRLANSTSNGTVN